MPPERWFPSMLRPGGAGPKVLAIVFCLVITVLSLLPGQERPHTGFSGNIEHVVAYAGTVGVTAYAFLSPGIAVLTLGFSAASAVFEICQLFIPGRSSGLDNWIASTLGALVGATAARHLLLPLVARWIRRA
ncbi:VanZ family protein [Xanthobacter autotrophicus DSM 597]|uniref:VanZ family protein n=1 Tax=Xanthobacter wiegelii TaxID=3119913 RepID=UPI00372B8891